MAWFYAAEWPTFAPPLTPRALHDHPRNLPDDLIQKCAQSGGVVGINGLSLFLGDPAASASTYARHIDYVVQLVGPLHVALGTDYVFDTAELDAFLAVMKDTFPAGQGYGDSALHMLQPEDLPQVVEQLFSWGYADSDVASILGGNLLRVARDSWKPASWFARQ